MDLFKLLGKGANVEGAASGNTQVQRSVDSHGSKSRRDAVYAVRVRDDFKSELLHLQAELQIERQDQFGKCSKVTGGEVIELMLEAFKAMRGRDKSPALVVPLSKDVCEGIHAIARVCRITPAQVVEELVVRQINELGLIPQKRG